MPLRDDDPIWYASYGSNCLYDRFNTYLIGGTAEGANRAEPGARDSRPPSRTEPFHFEAAVRYLGDSPKWGGGGVAFLDPSTPGRSPGRRYLVTKSQFDDIVAQESRRSTAEVDLDELEPGVLRAMGDGYYDGILLLGVDDGIPVVTFTSPRPIGALPTNPPSARYLRTIVRGLVEIHPTPVEQLAAALLESPGVAAGWTVESIAALAAK